MVGTDVSADALEVARANAAGSGWKSSGCSATCSTPVEGDVDAVVSNPPYIRDADPLPPEVARYEPAIALFAGADGLDLVRRLVAAAARAPFLALEVGEGQAAGGGARWCAADTRSVQPCRTSPASSGWWWRVREAFEGTRRRVACSRGHGVRAGV